MAHMTKEQEAQTREHLVRCTKDHVGYRYEDADDSKLIGFAMLISQLTIMRRVAGVRPLGVDDIQACIDAAMQEGKIDTKRTNTGQELFIHAAKEN